jgi:hypothetical protein
MLETNDRPADADRLLRRYTAQSFDTPAAWRKWLSENKSTLFFTDVGGYKWMTRGPAGK